MQDIENSKTKSNHFNGRVDSSQLDEAYSASYIEKQKKRNKSTYFFLMLWFNLISFVFGWEVSQIINNDSESKVIVVITGGCLIGTAIVFFIKRGVGNMFKPVGMLKIIRKWLSNYTLDAKALVYILLFGTVWACAFTIIYVLSEHGWPNLKR